MKNVFFIILITLIQTNTLMADVEGTLNIIDFKTEQIGERKISIWTPEQPLAKGQKYNVLYMMDGQMLFDASTTWNGQEWKVDEWITQLMAENKIAPTMVVGIWNAGASRHAEYYPQKALESMPKQLQDSLRYDVNRNADNPLFAEDVYSDRFLNTLVHEIKPYIDANYTTHTDAAHTYVAGSSMGGLISWYALCEYPEIFGGAACLSTHWIGVFLDNNPIPDSFAAYLEKHLPDPKTHKIYFDYGTKTLDAYYEPYQKQMDKVVSAKGYDNSSVLSLKFEGADHSENSWQQRLDKPLLFLLGIEQKD